MKKKKFYLTRGKNLFTIAMVAPFLIAVLFLLIGLFSLDNISLDAPFRFNVVAVLTLSLFHLCILIIIKRLHKIEFNFPVTMFKKIVSVFVNLLLMILSNFLLIMALKMNLNFWLRSDKVEKLELVVVGKNISYGKATDYYIIFDSRAGRFHNKVSSSNYDFFTIGQSFQASVKRGFYDGYYLAKPLH